MELTDYIRILRKNWLIIVLATLLGVGVAAGYSLTRTPMYDAQSTVFVSTQAGGTVAEMQQGSTFTQSRVTTYANLVDHPDRDEPRDRRARPRRLGEHAGEHGDGIQPAQHDPDHDLGRRTPIRCSRPTSRTPSRRA